METNEANAGSTAQSEPMGRGWERQDYDELGARLAISKRTKFQLALCGLSGKTFRRLNPPATQTAA